MKKVLAMLLAGVMVFSCMACGGQDNTQTSESTGETAAVDEETAEGTVEEPAEETVLKVWVAPALVSEEEQKMKQEEWYVSRVAKSLRKKTPE